MKCHPGCHACCIVISISSPVPGMQGGKPAGTRCIHLNEQNLCSLYGKPERPAICGLFQPAADTCGTNTEEAFRLLAELEEFVNSP